MSKYKKGDIVKIIGRDDFPRMRGHRHPPIGLISKIIAGGGSPFRLFFGPSGERYATVDSCLEKVINKSLRFQYQMQGPYIDEV